MLTNRIRQLKCHKCSCVVEPTYMYCHRCGNQLNFECSKCKIRGNSNILHCTSCGSKMKPCERLLNQSANPANEPSYCTKCGNRDAQVVNANVRPTSTNAAVINTTNTKPTSVGTGKVEGSKAETSSIKCKVSLLIGSDNKIVKQENGGGSRTCNFGNTDSFKVILQKIIQLYFPSKDIFCLCFVRFTCWKSLNPKLVYIIKYFNRLFFRTIIYISVCTLTKSF